MTGTAALNAAWAAVGSPLAAAARTFLMALRIFERSVTLWARRLTAWRARFSADLMLAKERDSGGWRRARDSAEHSLFCQRAQRLGHLPPHPAPTRYSAAPMSFSDAVPVRAAPF